jgi:glycosyltransferase involved in cell wall biosynthesis
MRISVILCTYNRCESLAKALSSVAASQVSSAIPWEVLVIDNNSSDSTRDVVEDFSRRYPGRFRYLFEARQGKSFALNQGVREASGDVLAFMDDDVTVEPSWLSKLTASLQSDRWAGAGGRVIPLWYTDRPKWLPDAGDILAALVSFDPGEQAGGLHEPPFGTNMAFRKKVFERYGDFRTDLGPRPDSAIRSEDTEFGRRVLNGGEELYYEPGAVVYHPVTPERLSKKYFLQWWFDKGRAEILEFPEDDAYSLGGIPLYLFKRILADTFRWTMALEPSRRFDYKRQVWELAGEITERRRLASAKQRLKLAKNTCKS